MSLVDKLERAAESVDDALSGGNHAYVVVDIPVISYALHVIDTAKRSKAEIRCNGEYRIAQKVFDGFLLGRFDQGNGEGDYQKPQFRENELSSMKVVLQEALRLYHDGVIRPPRATVF